ncbi:MAG: PA2169 family four-helix-bundle protein [Rhodocyclaceae bacterium]
MDPKEVISTLNGLIETCKDGEYGFRSCAEHVNVPELITLFSQRADDCRQAAHELQEQVMQLGGEPDTRGSAAGALHRGWVAVRSKLSSYDDLDVLKDCERGEEAAVAAYRAALEKTIPEPVRSLVERQYQGAQRNHKQIRELRDRTQTVR